MILNEQYFYDNNYWIESEDSKREGFRITSTTRKWRALLDTIYRTFDTNVLITPEMIMKTIDDDQIKRSPYHKSKPKPQGYLTTKELQAKKKKSLSIREARHKKYNANRKSK